MKILSVIIPAYNRESYIGAALDSVLSQKVPRGWKLEVIVADDGSTDKTLEVLKRYKNRIKIVELEHSGKPAVPRNAAIKVSTGEILAFQDSDDLWVPDKLLFQIPQFEDPELMLSFGQAEVIQENGLPTGEKVVDKRVLSKATSYEALLQQNAVSTLTVMARKEAIISVGSFNESDALRAIEDYDLWLRIAAKFPGSLKSTTRTLAYYRRHKNNISKGNTLKGIEDALKIYNSSWDNTSLSERQRSLLEAHIASMSQNWSDHMVELAPNKQPLISVIMSVYNGSRFLRQAVDSILSQTYKDFEFIIIDDGSTDNSAKIIENYDDSRIRLIRQTNHGLVYSLNKAIRLSRGRLIARMDADDISLPKRLQLEAEWLMSSNSNGLVSTYFEQIEFENNKKNGVTISLPPKHKDLRRALYFVNPFAHGAAMFRKDAIIEAGFYRANYGPTEDYDLWRRLLKKWRGHLIPEILFQYRVNNSESISQIHNQKQRKFVSKIHDELWGERFVRKNFVSIVYDYYFMREYVPPKYLLPTKNEYLNHQFTLSKFSFLRGFTVRGLEIALGILFIKPAYFFNLLIYLPQSMHTSIKRVKW